MGSGVCTICPAGQKQIVIVDNKQLAEEVQSDYKENDSEPHYQSTASGLKLNLQPIQFDDPDENRINKEILTKRTQSIKEQVQQIQGINLVNNQQNDRESESESEQHDESKLVLVNHRKQISNLDSVEIINSEQYTPLIVPFSVIQLCLPLQLKKKINQWDSQFISRCNQFQKIAKQPKDKWRLFKRGYYGRILKADFGIFIDDKQLYEGHFKKSDQNNYRHVPYKNGVLINQKSIYVGQFSEGKAHGRKGRLQVGKTVYTGQWHKGKMIRGTIDDPRYYYQGQISDNMPHGQGKLTIHRIPQISTEKSRIEKEVNISYEGGFRNGLFDGKNATYESDKQIYKGDFKDGKKNGEGILVMKQSKEKKEANGKIDRKKYVPPLKLVGYWENDQFKSQINRLQK